MAAGKYPALYQSTLEPEPVPNTYAADIAVDFPRTGGVAWVSLEASWLLADAYAPGQVVLTLLVNGTQAANGTYYYRAGFYIFATRTLAVGVPDVAGGTNTFRAVALGQPSLGTFVPLSMKLRVLVGTPPPPLFYRSPCSAAAYAEEGMAVAGGADDSAAEAAAATAVLDATSFEYATVSVTGIAALQCSATGPVTYTVSLWTRPRGFVPDGSLPEGAPLFTTAVTETAWGTNPTVATVVLQPPGPLPRGKYVVAMSVAATGEQSITQKNSWVSAFALPAQCVVGGGRARLLCGQACPRPSLSAVLPLTVESQPSWAVNIGATEPALDLRSYHHWLVMVTLTAAWFSDLQTAIAEALPVIENVVTGESVTAFDTAAQTFDHSSGRNYYSMSALYTVALPRGLYRVIGVVRTVINPVPGECTMSIIAVRQDD